MNLQLYIFVQLILKDLVLFYRSLWDKLIDLIIMLVLNVIVFGYFMPSTANNYATFILVGAIASFGFFEVVGKVGMLISDIDGDRTIDHKLILPIKTTWVLVAQAFSWALESIIINILLFPVGKLLLYNSFDLSAISYFKLVPMIVVANVFFGFFALWVTSMLKGGMRSISHLWVRFISPLYMFGCFFYTWQSAYALNPVVGYLSLLNPKVYVMEGTRSAVLGATGYLPFWFSFCALLIFIIVFGTHAISRLKTRLDFI